eukprot:530289-Pyramimonas_sp.AAC.1
MINTSSPDYVLLRLNIPRVEGQARLNVAIASPACAADPSPPRGPPSPLTFAGAEEKIASNRACPPTGGFVIAYQKLQDIQP